MRKSKERFTILAEDVSKIFKSFETVHTLYTTQIKKFSNDLSDLPENYKNEVSKGLKSLENCKESVTKEQNKISSQMYGQGIASLVGASESIFRKYFKTLFVYNISKVAYQKDLSFSIEEVSKIINYQNIADAGNAIFEKLSDDKSPESKLNFQNTQSLSGIMKGYLRIDLDEAKLLEMHKYTQIRHIIIHNSGIIDDRFMNNLHAANIDTSGYIIDQKIELSEFEFNKCKECLESIFMNLDDEVSRLDLKLSN